jgi:PASTA domain-containing protein
MAGHFYPLPPTFIGGQQPYAPKLGQVQSGSAPSNPPPINRASLRIIEARYREDPATVIYVSSIASQLSTPAAPDNAPVRTYANQRVILGQWDPVFRPLPYTIKIAPFIPAAAVPDNPPAQNYANRQVVARFWELPYRPLPSRVQVAPLLPAITPDSPPKIGLTNWDVILRQWMPPYVHFRLRVSQAVTVADTTPDAFTFVDQSNVDRTAIITSAAITVTGITGPAAITVTGGTYDVNASGAFTASAGTVNNGDTVRARHTSSASYSTTTNTVVTIGGVSDTFTSTTATAPAAVQELVPYLIGMTQSQAEAVIEALHCIPSVIGTSGTVTAQDPVAFTYVDRGSTVTVTLGGAINNASSRRRRGQVPYNRIQ